MTTYRLTQTVEIDASSAEQAENLIGEGEGHVVDMSAAWEVVRP